MSEIDRKELEKRLDQAEAVGILSGAGYKFDWEEGGFVMGSRTSYVPHKNARIVAAGIIMMDPKLKQKYTEKYFRQ